jgi:hypothetical protein
MPASISSAQFLRSAPGTNERLPKSQGDIAAGVMPRLVPFFWLIDAFSA